MTARRGRRVAWIGVGALLLSLGASLVLLRGFVAERLAIRDLRSQDVAVVSAALEKLAAMRSHRALPALVALYQEREKQRPVSESDDDDPTDAMQIMRAAARIGPRALTALMQASSEHELYFMAFLLRHLDDLAPALAACLEDPDPRVRRLAALGLRGGQAEEVIPQLESRLMDSAEAVRCAAAWSLAGMRPGDIAVRDAVDASLRSQDASLRREAASALLAIEPGAAKSVTARRVVPRLVALLQDLDNRVRVDAARVLACSGAEDAVGPLTASLGDLDDKVRLAALEALRVLAESTGDSHSWRAAGAPLRRVADKATDRHWVLLVDLILGLRPQLSRGAFPELLRIAEARDGDFCWGLAAVGSELGSRGTPALETILGWLGDGRHGKVDKHLLHLASLFGDAAQVVAPRLLELGAADHGGRGDSAIQALGRIARRDAGTVDSLTATLGDRAASAGLRWAAARALGQAGAGGSELVALLERALASENEARAVRRGAAAVLGSLGPRARQALPVIEALRRRGEPWVELGHAWWRIDPRQAGPIARELASEATSSGELEEVIAMGPLAAGAVPELLAGLASLASKPGSGSEVAISVQGWTLTRALCAIGRPAVPALIDALRSRDVVLRSRAAETLGLIGPAAEEAIPELEAALADADDEVRREAARALPRISVLRELHRPPEIPHSAPPRLAPLLKAADGAAITTREAWEARRRELRESWASFLGELPEPRVPLAMEILATEELTRVTRHHVRYAVEEGELVDGYLLVPWDLPADGSRRAPGVVVFHQTVESQAQQPAGVDPSRPGLHIALHLAEQGFVTLAPRCFIFAAGADYREHVRRTLERHPKWKGKTRMLLDGVRAADCLASLPYVDASRLGCIGHSLGAKETLYAAAFDERYRAAVFSEGGIGLGMTNWEDVWYLGPDAKRPDFPREHHELLALVAPRSFLLLAGGEGGADDARAWSYVEAALPVFRLHAAEARFGWRHHGYGHDYPQEARGQAEEFLRRALED